MQQAATPSLSLSNTLLKKVVHNYHEELASYQSRSDKEHGLRAAFQNLLAECAHNVGWTLIAEETLSSGIRPDATLYDTYFPRGYWEAKGPKSDLDKEIARKITTGYPLSNTIFENTRRAV